MRMTRIAPLVATATVLVLAGCSDSGSTESAAAPSYETDAGVSVRVLPQLAAEVNDKVSSADDAAWTVEASVEDAEEGSEVRLYARDSDEWKVVDEAETDESGRVALTTSFEGDLHVVTEGEDGDIGAEASTDEAPESSFVDDFEKDSLAGDDAMWATREQGYIGVRQCSKAAEEASKIDDGVLRLSVLDDPDKGECKLDGKSYDYRLNGHVATEQTYAFTYGFAAARVKFQPERGQHASFWLQTPGGPAGPNARKAGAEIDVIEYFGDGHPQGGLTSFTYWFDPSGKRHTQGGWIEDSEQYGEDWSDEFHVFSVEWTPKEYVFRIDGQATHRLKGPTSARPEFLILSLLSSDYELKHSEELPQTMEVDWARVWETPAG